MPLIEASLSDVVKMVPTFIFVYVVKKSIFDDRYYTVCMYVRYGLYSKHIS